MILEDYNILVDMLRWLSERYDFLRRDDSAELSRQDCLTGIDWQIGSLRKILGSERIHMNLTTLNIQEVDRQRIARDLHDTSLQNLAHLVHEIELCSLYIDKDPARAKLELSAINKNLRSVIDEIRNTIFDLRPMSFDDLGLKPAIERLMDVINENKKWVVDVDVDEVSCENNMVLVNIYRIIQESLNNIMKHAEANFVSLHCKYRDHKYVIDIRDNGVGFPAQDVVNDEGRHFGISLMKERTIILGGCIDVQSEPGNGTSIHIEIPISH